MAIRIYHPIVLAAVLAALAMSSCSKEIPGLAGNDGMGAGNDGMGAGNDVAQAETGEARTFTCVIEEPDGTKLSISNQGKTRWEEGDQILINAGSGGNTRETVTLKASDISADGKTASITITIPPYEHTHYQTGLRDDVSTYYAMYPADAVAPLPLYYNQAYSNTNAPLMAGCNKDNRIVFYNVCGIISFTVSGSFDSYIFSGNNDETVAYDVYQCRVRDTGSGPELTSPKTADSYQTLTPQTTVSGSVVADGSTVNYVCIPNGVSFSKGFTFKFLQGDNLVKVATTDTKVSIGRSKLLPLGNITSHLEDPSAAELHKSEIDLNSATDLGASETANCYIVSAPGNYKFKAVKGNSTTSVGTMAGVELLWETYNNATAPEKNSVIEAVDFEGQWIAFSTPASLQPGNALIAAKSASGTILWSWHIWIPETSIESSTYDISSHLMMDRNLGALVTAGTGAVEANGLLYQWGRKDPFVGLGAHGSSGKAKVAGTAMSVSSAAANGISEGIANPTRFIVGTGSNNNHDWLMTSDATLWGTTKTIHDPCPPGWKVPDYKEATPFTTQAHTLNGFNYDAGNYCMTVGSAVFPLTGYLYYTTGNMYKYDTSANVWTSHSSTGSSIGLAIWMSVEAADNSNNWSERKSRGCSVRCVSHDIAPFENEPGMPVQGGYTKIQFDSSIQELSGICFSKDKDFIWGVGDEGDIFKIYLDWTKSAITLKSISIYKSTGSDLEDVTLNPNTGDLYFAKEPDRVDKMAATSYSSKTQAFYVADAANFGNSGLEGIAWYKDNTLYVGAQTGATLWKYQLDGTRIWTKKLGDITPWITEVGGLCYDIKNDWLWVADSEAQKLFVFNGEVTKLLAMYDVKSVGNAESVMVVPEYNCVLVGDDGSTSKIYKYSFTGL